MSQRRFFMLSLNRVDLLTLGSLLLSFLGVAAAIDHWLSLAIGLMLLAMLVDMADGFLARRLHLESEFGRNLDTLCDVFAYLILPEFILFQMGMQDLVSAMALFAFLTAGVLRLSHFNTTGTVEQDGIDYHVGLQVLWSQLVVVLAFPAWHWLGSSLRYVVAALLVVMAVFMIRDLRFPKPVRYKLQAFAIAAVAGVYFYLHLEGVQVP